MHAKVMKNDSDPDPGRIMDAANAFHESCVLFAALDMDVFTRLSACGPTDAETLAAACNVPRRGLRLLLDGCAAVGLLCREEGVYSNAPEAEAFLVRGAPGDLGDAIRYNRDVYPAWGRLPELVRTGRPVERPQLHLGEDAARTETFVRAMHRRAMAIGHMVAPCLEMEGRTRVLDIGAGPGAYSHLLAGRWPQLQCVALDLPAVNAIARGITAEAGLSGRVQHLDGDYRRAALPTGFDAVLMFGVLHQERPETIADLMRRAREALNPGGVVYVLDMMTDSSRCRPRFSALFAINMALTTDDGWVFSDRELQEWMEGAGLVDFRCQHLAPPMPHWLARASQPA